MLGVSFNENMTFTLSFFSGGMFFPSWRPLEISEQNIIRVKVNISLLRLDWNVNNYNFKFCLFSRIRKCFAIILFLQRS